MNGIKANKKLRALTKCFCFNFKFIEGGALILYFSKNKIDYESAINIDCAWRFLQKKKILVGSQNEHPKIIKELNRIVGTKIIDIKSDEFSKDLRIQFKSGYSIVTFTNFTDLEIWEWAFQNGYRLGVNKHLNYYERWADPVELALMKQLRQKRLANNQNISKSAGFKLN